MKFYDTLLPRPQKIEASSGIFLWEKSLAASFSGLEREGAALFAGRLGAYMRFCNTDAPFEARFGTAPPAAMSEEAPGAYALVVAEEGVAIAACDTDGLRYGLFTLCAMIRQSRQLPCVRIMDRPAIKNRIIHLDLKGYQPRFNTLVELVDIYAEHKINGLLVEFEDKLRFRSAPGVGIDSAYTMEQLTELNSYCALRGVKLIPKLQCLGHVDYLLKNKAYAHLRENNHPYQFCCRSEEAMDLWKAMADEIIAAMPGLTHFHIGADETGHLDECPVCKEYTKADNYVYRVQGAIDYIEDKGLTPVFWDDIIRNLHGNLPDNQLEKTWGLGRKGIVNYWAYGYGGKDNTFPFLAPFIEKGMTVWGASGISGCGPSWIQNIAPLKERALNTRAWTKSAREFGLEAVVATSWGRIGSADPPAESQIGTLLPALHAAECYWNGNDIGLDDFFSRAGFSLFGTGIGDYCLTADPDDIPDEGHLPVPVRHKDVYYLIDALSRIALHDRVRDDFSEHRRIYHGLLGVKLEDYRVDFMGKKIEGFAESLGKNESRVRTCLEACYEDQTVRAVMDSRFGSDRIELERAREDLGKTELA